MHIFQHEAFAQALRDEWFSKATALRAALLPVAGMVQRRYQSLKIDDPAAQKAIQGLQQIEAVIDAVADYHASTEALLNAAAGATRRGYRRPFEFLLQFVEDNPEGLPDVIESRHQTSDSYLKQRDIRQSFIASLQARYPNGINPNAQAPTPRHARQ